MVFLVMIYLASVHLMGGKGSTITDRLVADKGQHEGGREISIPAFISIFTLFFSGLFSACTSQTSQ